MRDVVLIHSTGQGAAGWRRVVHALAERGQAAHAVELPSDPDLLAADDAELIHRHVGALATPIVLAHSGAGPLLPATARALEACHQVWLAAWVPDPEVSFVEDTELHRQAAFNPDWIGKDPTEDDAVAAAVARVVGLGGSVVREPGFFREPGNPDPVLEWAVLADPFGNEFCLIRELPEPDAPS